MNLVGKILVFLILLMSVIFMGFAVAVYSGHQDWIAKANEYKTKLTAEQKRNQELQSEFASAQSKVSEAEASRRQALAKLETEKDQLQQEKTAAAKQLEDLNTNYVKVTAEASNALSQLKDKQNQVDSLRNDIEVARADRDENFKKVVDATDKLNQSAGELKRLEAVNVRLAEQNAKAKIRLERAGINPEAPLIPPALDGIVLATASNGLVEVSLGSDMGLARGNTLEVSRGSKYLGRLEVRNFRRAGSKRKTASSPV
jgi:hypothetical protein